jgi:hypothetical protein
MNRSLVILLMLPVFASAEEVKLSVKQEKVAIPVALDEAVRTLLDEQALQVLDGKGAVHCTIWLRKEIPSNAAPEQVKNGLTYREIQASTWIGAIQLPEEWVDFRKQKIPAGIYTLRLGFQPTCSDHMGTAPHSEFLLLSPADKDTSPALMEVKSLIDLSGASHGSTHPAVLMLFPNSKPADQPALVSKGEGIFVVNTKCTVVAGKEKTTLGFGLVVKGHSKARD